MKYSIEKLIPHATKKKNLSIPKRESLMHYEDKYPWEYNNLMYQVLACAQHDLVDYFARLMGEANKPSEVYQEGGLYYRKGDGWKWEHTKNGHPLGPHGLELSEQAAIRLGRVMRFLFFGKSRRRITHVKIPPGMWQGIGKDEFKSYSYGCFASSHTVFAVGYVAQVIAVGPGGVRIQLYDEDWDDKKGEFMDNDRNRFNHPRWNFVKDIVEADNIKYLEMKTKELNLQGKRALKL